ncbi:MAG: ABC transporter permease [Bryobacterales bacterium]|nr:ABC transporter permease [Bryobacterales bacterium]
MQITVGENLRMAFGAVWVHRFRSLLTILGIVIGITTVITVASLLTGLRKGVVTFFEEFGPDNIFVFKTSGDPNRTQIPEKEARRKPILPEYADIIKRWSLAVDDTGVQIYIPSVVQNQPLVAKVPGFESDNLSLVGSSPSMASISPRELREGRYFTADEDARAARVAMLGANLAETLFPDGGAAGKPFMLDGAEYTVVGVFAKAKGGFFGENGMDRQVMIPLRTAEARYPQVDRYLITVRARTGLRQQAFEEVEAILRRIRRTPAGAENDFSLSTPDQIIKQFDRITGLIGLVAIAISGLGLLVGGIGVMNIMLVSVTERTREIGVRKAIGARRGDIVGQFLLEAMTLTGAGGTLGVLFAIEVTMLVGALVPSLPSDVPAWAVVAGFCVSVAVGVFFGVWPAVKASRLDPVDALRYE